MKLVLAAPLYPPDIGGPSFYAERLTLAWRKLGHETIVVNFGAYKHLPSGVRHIAYLAAVAQAARGATAIVALDTFSAAVPAVFASKFVRVPLVTRIGGDYLWEQYVNRTLDDVPITVFYKAPRKFVFKDKIVRMLTNMVVRNSVVVFSSAFQRDIWTEPYKLGVSHIIENAIADNQVSVVPVKKNFVCFSRDIPLKNLARLKLAAALAKKSYPEIVLETGPVSQEDLVCRVSEAYAVIVPSVSEITPNFVLDAIRCGKPFIQTKYSAYAEKFTQYGLLLDPFNVQDIATKMGALCDDATYDKFVDYGKTHPFTRSYDDIAREFVELIKSI